MTKLNLKNFEKKIILRPLTFDDFKEVTELQLKCFSGMKPWKEDQFKSQLAHFPEGQLCLEYQGKIVASSSSLIVEFSEYSNWHSWQEMSDSGFIRNHDPEGDTLYGIEIMVDPSFRGLRLARRLYDERKQLAIRRNLTRIMIGGRIPNYGKHSKKMSATEYVERVMAKKILDPVLTTQLSNGFVLKRIIPNYMASDQESKGYATFLEWNNLNHVDAGKGSLMAVDPVRLSVVQYGMRTIKSFSEFAKQCEFFTDVGSDYKSDFVLFPELFTTQLLSCIKSSRPGDAARKLAEFTPEYLDLFNKLAIKYNINIIGGSQFTVEDDNLYNIAYLFQRNGKISKQYKIHITPSEKRWWGVVPGNRVEVFDTDKGKINIQICYDVEFPELSRIAVTKGAKIIFVPFNTDDRDAYLRVRYCAQARCIENQVFTAIAGCVGNLPFVDNADVHYAESGIFTPSDVSFERDGIAADCIANSETIVTHDVDLALLKRSRRGGSVRNWLDRRTDLYNVVVKEEEEVTNSGK